MLNLSNDLASYIELLFPGNRKPSVLSCFSLLEQFSLPDYETKYMDTLYSNNRSDPIDKVDIFIDLLYGDMISIIEDHDIVISKDVGASLDELIEVCNLLLILPRLEDMTSVRYRVLSEAEPTDIFVQLLERYTSLSTIRSMEIVESVSKSLIDSIEELCSTVEDNTVTIDREHKKYAERFFAFIDNTPCLGLKLYEEGYGVKLNLDELLNLSSVPIDDLISKTLITNPAQAALDTLSLLVITKGDYDVPLVKFKDNVDVFTKDTMEVTRLSHMVLGIMNDFSNYLEAIKQQEKLNRE